jgi:enoyl-CoA hydratase
MYSQYRKLSFERRGFVLTVALNNPPANAVNYELHSELAQVFRDIQRDPSCNVVILTGLGKYFSGGGDLKQMLQNLDDHDRMASEMADAPQIVHALLALEKPTIARVNGHAMGLGATLALLCDVVFASESAKIADPHVNVGLSAGDGGSLIWPHLIGYAKARHHLFTGEPLSGAEAVAAGLIYKSLPAAELDAEVDAYADLLAAKPFRALSATKKSLNMALCRQALFEAEAHIGLETLSMMASDHREALLAMIEKREPNFNHGRQ